MRRHISLLACALVCGALSAGDTAFGFSLGYQQQMDSKKMNFASDSLFVGADMKNGNAAELGLNLSVVHGERFSTRWGFVMTVGQKADVGYPYVPESLDRGMYGFYVQGNLNIINGVGKTWYLTAGPTYNYYNISSGSGDASVTLDKVSKVGAIFGTGVSFNGKTMRWTPEVLVQKVGEETTGIFRLHIQYQF